MSNKVVIIGAGVSGLTVANRLVNSAETVILEKEKVAGGLSTTYDSVGSDGAGGLKHYYFDYSGHYFHFQDNTELKDLLDSLCPFKKFNRKSMTYLLNRYIPFPVQFNLSHLPSGIKNKIFKEMMKHIDFEPSSFSPENLEEFLLYHFGQTLYELFFNPFLTKYYNTSPSLLAANMDKGSIPVPDKTQVEEGFKGRSLSNVGYNAVIYYPKTSLKDLIDHFSESVKSCLHLEEEVMAIDWQEKVVKTGVNSYSYDKLVTSIPLKELLKIITPADRFPTPESLKHTSTVLVNVILKRKRKRFHWVYLAEEKFPFYRVGLYAVHPYPACYMERNVSPGTPIDKDKLFEEVIFTLKELKIIEQPDEIIHIDSRIIPISYVIFDQQWSRIVPPLLQTLKSMDIYSIGRYGSWNYSSMGNDINAALRCVKEIEEELK